MKIAIPALLVATAATTYGVNKAIRSEGPTQWITPVATSLGGTAALSIGAFMGVIGLAVNDVGAQGFGGMALVLGAALITGTVIGSVSGAMQN